MHIHTCLYVYIRADQLILILEYACMYVCTYVFRCSYSTYTFQVSKYIAWGCLILRVLWLGCGLAAWLVWCRLGWLAFGLAGLLLAWLAWLAGCLVGWPLGRELLGGWLAPFWLAGWLGGGGCGGCGLLGSLGSFLCGTLHADALVCACARSQSVIGSPLVMHIIHTKIKYNINHVMSYHIIL